MSGPRGSGPVVVRLQGGLGNQMFQYATAFALARRRGAVVLLDQRTLPTGVMPALLRWQLAAQPAAQPAGRPLVWPYSRPVLALARRQPWFARLWRCHAETGLRFDASLQARDGPLYLDGHFQSERYFADQTAALRLQYRPRASACIPAVVALRERIAACEHSVAVHVRRGDYLQGVNPTVHGVCSADYYEAAARLVLQRTGRAHYFVFSDDLAWARAALQLPGPCTFVDGHAAQPEIDLHLMAQCRHHVCANSSFSWWGAWLASHDTQVVVAPRRWFQAPHLDAADLVPARWLRL